MNKSTVYLQADEIDHITIRYTDFGEKLNRKESIRKILFYYACYEEVAEATEKFGIRKENLEKKEDSELYDILVIIRTILLGTILNK